MQTLLIISNVVAMLLGMLAAWLWYKSAVVQVSIANGNKTGPEIDVDGFAFIATARQQALWNRRGAMAAAGAAFFQAIGLAASLAAT